MRLTTSPAVEGSPAWSPDDRWIAFTRQQQGNVAVMLIPPLGGPERKLTEMMGVGGLSWTPDGKWLAFGAQDSLKEPRSIWAISIQTGERRRLTAFLTKSVTAEGRFGRLFPVDLSGWPHPGIRPAGEKLRITNSICCG